MTAVVFKNCSYLTIMPCDDVRHKIGAFYIKYIGKTFANIIVLNCMLCQFKLLCIAIFISALVS